MNLAEWSIRKSLITWVMTILFLVVGWSSYQQLSRLEDPEFTIKDAVITTPYPGASAAEVEEEVTNLIEKAAQQMGQLKRVESRSSRGLSWVKVSMQDKYDKNSLPQVWDELRRKINDAQRFLPPGAGPSLVNDDFGDVYGIFLAITGEGYSYKEIYEYAKLLQRELLKASDVKRIVLYGDQKEAVYVEMRREKMAQLGISPQDIYSALKSKNIATSAGNLLLGEEYIPISPTGEFKSEQDFGDLLIRSSNAKSDSLIYLRDVAEIKRGYQDPPVTLLRYDGKTAIGLAISTIQGGNVMVMSDSLDQRFKELETLRPIGMELNIISHQAQSVKTSLTGFLINLAEAVAIVVGVLLLFMGLRSGLILGVVLMVTIMGTFIFMQINHITLERISLGALIIALGMLVDCAIVVTDGMRMQMAQGKSGFDAAKDIVGQTALPMLGGTIVAITAFAAIGTSQDSTGEYCRTLFSVILYSLTLSWLTAVTCTPLLCATFLKVTPGKADNTNNDPYGKGFYRLYSHFLAGCIRFRWVVVAVAIALFISALLGFGYIKNSFFPDSTRPQFYVDIWFPEGTDIRETQRQFKIAEATLKKHEGVTHLTSTIGGNQVRFLLTYTPESNYPSYGQILVDVDDYTRIKTLAPEVQKELEGLFPGAISNMRLFVLGPSTGGKIQLRIYGPDAEQLRILNNKAETILLNDPNARAVRNEWREKIKVVRPQMAETQARRAGIDRPELAQALESAFQGTKVGIYRERDELIPVLARAPTTERTDLDSLDGIQIWSPAAQSMIPMGQIVSGFTTEFEDAYVWRNDRRKMIRLHADPRQGLASELFAQVKAKIEQALNVDVAGVLGHELGDTPFDAKTLKVQDNDLWPLKDKPGYYMAWGGEAEDSARANASLASSIPMFFGIMVLIVLVLFNSIKKMLVIWLTVPLALIGVTVGLLVFKQPFGFMALLGLMSLSGMAIKASIVLVDEIGVQIGQGKTPYQAVLSAGVSRLIPVTMSSGTTMLGMIPLFTDAFFISMAVTIVFGLGFATLLILIVVPVLYSLFFNIHEDDKNLDVAQPQTGSVE
ncbi:efflux RND transporter permease subunit [Methylobacter sp. S3L5C]|uniref:efflux RND transporter permease subunit n=1 Tax=Methylobacter sp. S3L5C TaxID=2839024 RepID=UPI001FABD0BD|nr:efflux RND transporter permease subunit [Methylobacter sp. S3L5C]UOA09756.1 efflux RND transporter permease subunit [Methylobacter sp. S3L5C]